jgi:hypothetical protein
MIGGLRVAVECENCGAGGTVFQREDGRWLCTFCQDDELGRCTDGFCAECDEVAA